MEKLNLRFWFRGGPELIKLLKTMKLIVLLLVVSAGTLFAEVSAQGTKLDLKVENKSLIEVMDLLKAKSGYSFIFSAGDVENIKGISLDVTDKSVEDVLTMALKNTGLTYVIEGELIILKQMPNQVDDNKPQVLSGVVLDQAKDTLPGVTVLIKGTSIGVVTDNHGRYKITLPKGDNVSLIFSFIGKKTKTIAYTGQKELNVILEDDAHEMEEVIVTGYQQIDKRHMTSSVTSLKAEDIMMPGMTSIDKMLESRVPGLIFMQNSGQVGAAPRLRIRGTSTIMGNQEPLWVVDGVVQTDPVNVDPAKINDLDFVNLLGNAISGLNPYDIEDINVMKDASATALYGTRAANGVIMITTKQGKAGPMRLGYHVDGSFRTRPRYTDRTVNMMDSRERIDYSREIVEKKLYYSAKDGGWGGYEAILENYYKGLVNFEEFQAKVSEYESMNTDWLGETMQNSFSHNHTLSFSGGAEKMKYYASVGYGRENGVIQKEFGDRYSAMLSLSFTGEKFSAQFKLSGNMKEQEHTPSDVGLLSYAYTTSRALPLYDKDGSLFYTKVKKEGNPVAVYFNVLNERDHSYQTISGNSISFQTNVNYNFFPNLKAGVTFSYSTSNTEENTYHGEETAYAASFANYEGDPRYTEFESPNNRQSLWPFGGELKKSNTRNKNYMLRGQLDWHKFLDVEQNHMLSAAAGGELNSSVYTGYAKTIRCYLPDRGLTIGSVDKDVFPKYAQWLATNANALGKLKDNTSNKLGFYGTLTYSYENTYIFNVNARLDFSNEFGKQTNDKLLPVWSVSGRWNLKENVLSSVNWVNDVALRASFGYQGNISAEATPELIIKKGERNIFFDEYESSITKFPNPNLGWEKTMSFNSTLDFSLFKNMLKGSVSFFYKKTKNAYLTKKVPRVNGVSSYTVNEGTVENQGLEFNFNIIPVNTMMSNVKTAGERRGFRWSIDPQLGQVVNKLLDKVTDGNDFNTVHDEFKFGDYLSGNAYVTGRPLNSFFSYEFAGLDADDGRPTFARTGEENFEKFIEMTKSQVYTHVMKYSGCRVPYLQGGISNTFEYRNMVLSFNLAYSIGSKIRLLKLYENIGPNSAPQPIYNVRREFVNRWQKRGDEAHTNIPGLLQQSEYGRTLDPWWFKEPYKFAENIWQMYNFSDVRVVSGNYLKLQSVSFRYVFPESLCKKMGINNMYLSLSGNNLFTWSAKELKGQDPTSQSGSSSSINLSVRPTYSLSLDVAF